MNKIKACLHETCFLMEEYRQLQPMQPMSKLYSMLESHKCFGEMSKSSSKVRGQEVGVCNRSGGGKFVTLERKMGINC